jgi:hypothetical protein
MKGGMGSHVGVIITVPGVAGGVGCIPCAGVAAFYTGVLSVGRMPSVKLTNETPNPNTDPNPNMQQ